MPFGAILFLALGFMAPATLAQKQPKEIPPPPVPPTFSNVSYGPHERHVLDLWQAKSDGPAPLVVFIHGGGWHGGDKNSVPAKLLTFLLDHGISVASINYRYTSMAILPGPDLDAARAIQFLRSKSAEWNLDPRRFAAAGISAGGCSALWLAYHDDVANPQSKDPVERQSSRLQAAVGISAQSSLDPKVVVEWIGDQVLKHPMIMRAVGGKKLDEVQTRYAEFGPLLREASPINHVTKDDPPVLMAFPKREPLPAASAGAAIHHAMFGIKLKEKADQTGTVCLLRIDSESPSQPTPEEFLLQQLKTP